MPNIFHFFLQITLMTWAAVEVIKALNSEILVNKIQIHNLAETFFFENGFESKYIYAAGSEPYWKKTRIVSYNFFIQLSGEKCLKYDAIDDNSK